jgi:tetratricopeptide (TPR) repeat protein
MKRIMMLATALVLSAIFSAFADDVKQGMESPIPSATDRLAEEQLERGFGFIKSGKYRQAMYVFDEALIYNSDVPEAYFGLGISYYKLGELGNGFNIEKIQQAKEAFQEAIKLKPELTEAHYILGLCYIALGDIKAAVGEYNLLNERNKALAEQLAIKIPGYQRPAKYASVETERQKAERNQREARQAARDGEVKREERQHKYEGWAKEAYDKFMLGR